MNLVATSTRDQLLLLLVILAMLSGSVTTRCFMLGDRFNQQRETDEVLVTFVNQSSSLDHGIESLSATPTNVRGHFKYELGKRFGGDQLVAHSAHQFKWQFLINGTINMTYHPPNGPLITYVSLDYNQTSDISRVYIREGGLLQRSLSLAIESYNFDYFYYNIQLYGLL